MNNSAKIFFRLILLPFLYIISSQLYAHNLFQNKDKTILDTLTNKTINQQDSLTDVKRKISLNQLKILPLRDENFQNLFLGKKILETIDYRTVADFFINIPFGFDRDLGSVGQPNEILLYGHGFGNVTFLSDGISINNRLSNSFNPNLFQSESIDSIEVLSLSQGFLYSGSNNPVSVNFISREPNTRRPYSRIKYYQAANGEGMIDGIFNISPFNRLIAYFELTNQSINPIYTNSINNTTKIGTDHSNWMGSVRLRYLLSNNINIIASYKYVQTNTQLFGGIDADSISRAYPASQFETILYDNFRAPVKFTNRYQKVSGHNLTLRLLGNVIVDSPTDLSFYYQTNLNEYRQNDSSDIIQKNKPQIFDNNESKTIGFNLRQDFKFDFLKLTSITNFERSTYNSPLLSQETYKPYFYTAAIANIKLFDNSLAPFLFAKYLNYSNNDYFGIGADLFYALSSSLKFYAGFSSFEKPRTIWEERFIIPTLKLEKQKISTIEFSATIENNFTKVAVGYFDQSSNNTLLATMFTDISQREQTAYFAMKDLRLQGINLNLNFKIWKVLFCTNTSYYFSLQNRKDYKLPEFTSYGGVYYVDTLFNNNLKMKAGLNYSSIGERSYIGMDFEKNISSYYSLNPFASSDITYPNISSSFQLDFFLAGKIQNAATVYVVYENIFNTKYYILPYYPKQSRGLRFGVAWEFLD